MIQKTRNAHGIAGFFASYILCLPSFHIKRVIGLNSALIDPFAVIQVDDLQFLTTF